MALHAVLRYPNAKQEPIQCQGPCLWFGPIGNGGGALLRVYQRAGGQRSLLHIPRRAARVSDGSALSGHPGDTDKRPPSSDTRWGSYEELQKYIVSKIPRSVYNGQLWNLRCFFPEYGNKMFKDCTKLGNHFPCYHHLSRLHVVHWRPDAICLLLIYALSVCLGYGRRLSPLSVCPYISGTFQ